MSKQNASSVGAEMRDQCPRRFGAGRAFARSFFTPSLSSAGGKCIGHKPLSQQVSQSAATQTESYQGQSGQEPPGTTPVPPGSHSEGTQAALHHHSHHPHALSLCERFVKKATDSPSWLDREGDDQ